MDWLFSFIPWWAWAVIALGAAGVVRIYTGSWRLAFAVITLGASLAIQSRSYNKGWKAREMKGHKDADKTITQAGKARVAADRLNSDPSRLRDNDGFKRTD